MPDPAPPASLHGPILATVAVYAAGTTLWILLSDSLVEALAQDEAALARWQSAKGLLFVAVSAALLYALLFLLARHRRGIEQRAAAAQAGAQRAQQLLQSMADASADAIFAKDLQGRYLLLNREAARVIGVDAAQALGRDDTQLLPPEQAAAVQANDRAVLASGKVQSFEEVVNGADGRRVFLASKGPLREGDAVIGLFGISRDITERVHTRQQLVDAEQRYRRLFKASPAPMWVFDRETLRFLAVNEAAQAQYGYSRDEFLQRTIADLRPPEHHAALAAALSLVDASARPGYMRHGVFVHQRRDGSLLDVDVTSHDFTFDGRPARLVMALDVTDRLRAERALREREEALRLSEQRYRLAANTGHVWDWDVRTGLTVTVPTFWQRLGIPTPTPEQAAATLAAHMHPDDQPRWRAAVQAHLVDHQPYALDFRMRHADGSWRWFHTQGQAVWDDGGHATYMAGTTFDVTEQRNAEQALLQSQLELSELAQRLLDQERVLTQQLAQALHDRLGQWLGSARLHLDLAQAQAPALAPLGRTAALLDSAVQEVRRMLAQLRPPLLEDQGLAASLEAELGSVHGLGVALSLQADDAARNAAWPAPVAYAAFMVAREALANALRHAGAGAVTVTLAGDGHWLRLTVYDDGSGIAPAQLAGRPGHLGIVGMRERALAIGARLEIGAPPAGGTRVVLHWGGSGVSSVYLVDDHALMRDGLRAVLEHGGHRVLGEADDLDESLH